MSESVPVQEQIPKQIPPEMKIMQDLIRQLMEACTALVIKVAVCDCEKREECPIFKIAKEIAVIIDRVQEMRMKGPKEVTGVGS